MPYRVILSDSEINDILKGSALKNPPPFEKGGRKLRSSPFQLSILFQIREADAVYQFLLEEQKQQRDRQHRQYTAGKRQTQVRAVRLR